MNDLLTYLLELNLTLLILYAAYRVLFRKDRNFRVRRTYLLFVMVLPFILPLFPVLSKLPSVNVAFLPVHLEGITVNGSGTTIDPSHSMTPAGITGTIYIIVVGLGIMKLLIQLSGIFHAIKHSQKTALLGIPVLASPRLHASSFFGYIFMDTTVGDRGVLKHILEHEQTHTREWHSIDRILAELFVVINWFNPVAWLFRRSLIENHEFLADSAVLRRGTDPVKYQLSILNQYIGSASIANQFSNQIKNRIKMLDKDYKLGSWWKLTVIFPMVFLALIIVSCADQPAEVPEAVAEMQEQATANPASTISGDVFFVVEDMPTFNGGDAATEFRYYITQNVRYPKEAAEKGVTGRIFIHFIVNDEGKVVVPDEKTMARLEGKSIDEVVVVTYSTLDEVSEVPDEKYINMLKEEVIRVVSSSPDWEPGRQRGTAVNVAFTFPVNFVLQ